MIRLSTGILSAAISLIGYIKKYPQIMLGEIVANSFISGIDINDVIDTAIKCDWIISNNKKYVISKKGESYLIYHLKNGITQELIRKLITDYISLCKPIWVNRIPYGRKEAYFIMSKDEKRCFIDAGLMEDNPNLSIIEWWDSISQNIRLNNNMNLIDIGREGELNTIAFEKKRTGIQPILQSINSNLSGYDVISVVSSNDTTKLLIEVKTSKVYLENAEFILTRKEWDTAKDARNYLIYLWLLSDSNKLAVISVTEIEKYIPNDNDEGKWLEVKIPFRVFSDYFKQPVLLFKETRRQM